MKENRNFFDAFGLMFGKSKTPSEEKEFISSPVPKETDGAIIIEEPPVHGGAFVHGISFDGVFSSDEARIKNYRLMARNSYIAQAIDEIINDAISFDEEKGVVEVGLDKTNFSAGIKKKIIQEFKTVIELLKFNFRGYETFSRWYVDGMLYANIVVDPSRTQDGIQEIRMMDPLATSKVINIQRDKRGIETSREEFYIYNPDRDTSYSNFNPRTNVVSNTSRARRKVANRSTNYAYKLTKDSVIYIWSGLKNEDGAVISYLDDAVKPWNQLTSLEDAILVYWLSRAPETRAFYTGTGDLPKAQSEAYIKKMMDRSKTRATYDVNTGRVDNSSQLHTMFQDFWFPRSTDGKTTEVQTIGGTQSTFANLDTLDSFIKKLYRSLKIPLTRVNSETAGNPFSQNTEISRDELKFQKFITRLRNRFSELLFETLRRQLLLKNIITQEDWEENSNNIAFQFAQDNMFFSLKQMEMIERRMACVNQVKDFTGKTGFFSKTWIRRNILDMSDEDEQQIKKEIEQEESEGDLMPGSEGGQPTEPSQYTNIGKSGDQPPQPPDDDIGLEIGERT